MQLLSFFEKKRASLWVALFFLAMTLVGVVTSFDYGHNFDAVSELDILQANIYEYAYQILGEEHSFTQYLAWRGYSRENRK